MQHQFQETQPFYTGLRVHAHVPPRTCIPPGVEKHQASSSGQGKREKKLRQKMLYPVERCVILLVPHIQSLSFIIMGNWARSHLHLSRIIQNGYFQGWYSINLKSPFSQLLTIMQQSYFLECLLCDSHCLTSFNPNKTL